MRIFLSGLSALLCCVLLMGAVGFDAPVMPTKSFYINDYAGVMEKESRDNMLKIAEKLYEETGVQAVVLTIESFGSFTSDEYAKKIFDSWGIGETHGTVTKKGMLILLCTEEKRIVTHSNTDITVTHSMDMANKLAAGGNFDDAASTCFFAVVDSVYRDYAVQNGEQISSGSENVISESSVTGESVSQGVPDTQSTEALPNTQNTNETNGENDRLYILAFGLFLLIALRAVRVSMKYRKKYNSNKSYYQRSIPKKYDYRRAVRHDDGDYPSGFGGLGNRKAIYGEDVDEAEDVGIKEHDYEDVFDKKEQNRQKDSDTCDTL